MFFEQAGKMNRLIVFVMVIGAVLVGTLPTAVDGSPSDERPLDRDMPWNIAAYRQTPQFQWIDSKSPIKSLVYANEPFNGQPTEVFAFYATPGSLAGNPELDKDLPAVVLIHGGGGTAFAEWVQLWAKRGYAAIAMDLSGRQPTAPEFDAASGELKIQKDHRKLERVRLKNGGPEHGHVQKFSNVGGDLSDDWQVHSVAAVMRAHSLIRSFAEVNPEKTAVTGISWGGYMTCLVASLDHRFRAAVPVYGCGYLYEGESVQKRQIDSLPDQQRAEWIAMYDPSAWLPQCQVPILFVNGTNDVHYPLNSYAKSYSLVQGPRQIRIEVNMRHGHPPGWEPQEIGLFIDHLLIGGQALPVFESPEMTGQRLTANCNVAALPATAQLHFTTDTGLLSDRKWQSVEATFDQDSGVVSATVPEEALIWFVSATDSRGAMTSSEVLFAK